MIHTLQANGNPEYYELPNGMIYAIWWSPQGLKTIIGNKESFGKQEGYQKAESEVTQ